jgi:pyoverdine/dityrosine biosynthesis protein Dit1
MSLNRFVTDVLDSYRERFFADFLARTRKSVACRGETRRGRGSEVRKSALATRRKSQTNFWIPAFAGMTEL